MTLPMGRSLLQSGNPTGPESIRHVEEATRRGLKRRSFWRISTAGGPYRRVARDIGMRNFRRKGHRPQKRNARPEKRAKLRSFLFDASREIPSQERRMQRSSINAAIRHAEALLARFSFALPPFAAWSAADWVDNRARSEEIRRAGLGWDVTDFGQGRFAELGLTLFTIRNGDARNLATGKGMVYAEKAIIVREGQRCPLHYHFVKTEDIINRGGGVLALELIETDASGQPDDARDVVVRTDGIARRLAPRGVLRLHPGESVTLTPLLAHAFWAEGGDVFVGEVSTVNDDKTDNAFLENVGRFPTIEEDAPAYRPIVGDLA